jgi:AcrR family transcriptional regulator
MIMVPDNNERSFVRQSDKLEHMPRSSAAAARRTHDAIVARAVHVASLEGLEGLTIGRLATDLGMSKAGVIGRFGSKEDLQLATLAAAIELWIERVWRPAEETAEGLQRLRAVAGTWSEFLGDCPFPGGCFVSAAAFEFDGRSGRVHDAVKAALDRWLSVLAREARVAIAAGELKGDPDQIAFELNAIAVGTNVAFQLQGDPGAPQRCRRAMERVLTR